MRPYEEGKAIADLQNEVSDLKRRLDGLSACMGNLQAHRYELISCTVLDKLAEDAQSNALDALLQAAHHVCTEASRNDLSKWLAHAVEALTITLKPFDKHLATGKEFKE